MVDAVLAIKKADQPADLHMVEMMDMQHKTDMDTQYGLDARVTRVTTLTISYYIICSGTTSSHTVMSPGPCSLIKCVPGCWCFVAG